jgi:hypothetical protein
MLRSRRGVAHKCGGICDAGAFDSGGHESDQCFNFLLGALVDSRLLGVSKIGLSQTRKGASLGVL